MPSDGLHSYGSPNEFSGIPGLTPSGRALLAYRASPVITALLRRTDGPSIMHSTAELGAHT